MTNPPNVWRREGDAAVVLISSERIEESVMSLLRPLWQVRSRVISIAAIILAAGAVSAQDYPAKLIRVVTSPPGGGNDFAARLIVKGLTEKTGWQVIIDNRPNIIAAETVSRAAPDGYTLLVAGGVFTTGHLI